jgi:4-hydroxybenzoyl-CoA thioesterase
MRGASTFMAHMADESNPTAPAACFARRTAIRFSDCDPAGIVFYPQYFVLFNGLVEDWVTEELGIGFAHLIGERRIGLPTVRLETEFLAPSRMGEEVVLGLQVERLGNSSLTLRVHCRSVEGTVRVQVRQVLVFTRLDTGRAIPLPEDVRGAIERFRAA